MKWTWKARFRVIIGIQIILAICGFIALRFERWEIWGLFTVLVFAIPTALHISARRKWNQLKEDYLLGKIPPDIIIKKAKEQEESDG